MVNKEDIAYEGYALLGERVRTVDDKKLVKEIIKSSLNVKELNEK